MIDVKFIYEKWVLGQHGGWYHNYRYEKKVRDVANRIHGKLFVDVGAHKLYYSNMLALNFDTVLAFEPNKNLELLPKWNNIRVLRTALSDHIGSDQFYCYNNRGADSLIKDYDYHVKGRNYAPDQIGHFENLIDSFPVQVTTYDLAVGTIADLVKIDVEGAEFDVLNGMRQYPPKRIIIEIHDQRREKELVALMSDRGYDYSPIDTCHWLFRH